MSSSALGGTRSGTKLREIERLRGVAILLVFLYHVAPAWPALPELVQKGWSGVDLFFVISGFVVTLSLERLFPDVSGAPDVVVAFHEAWGAVRRFWVRRLYRLAPMAVFLVALNMALTYASHGSAAFNSFQEEKVEAVALFAGVLNYAPEASKYLGHLWSLTVEEHFYLLLPIVFICARTRARRVVVCAALLLMVALVVRPLGAHSGTFFTERTGSHLRFDALFAGVLLALLRSPSGPAPTTLPKWFAAAVLVPGCIALLGMLPAVVSNADAFNWGSIAFWFFSLILVAYAARDQGYVLPVPGLSHALEYVGSRSYGLYLVHQPVFRAWEWLCGTAFLGTRLAPLLNYKGVLLILGVCLLICDLAYRCIERPFMQMGRTQTRPPEAPASPIGATRWPVIAARVAGIAALFVALLVFGRKPWRPKVWKVEHYSNRALWRAPDRVMHRALLPLPGVETEFSLRARSCLYLNRPMKVAFTLQADDGSRLFVDGARTIDLWGSADRTADTIVKDLPAGSHPLKLEYFQGPGDAYLRLLMTFDGGKQLDSSEVSLVACE